MKTKPGLILLGVLSLWVVCMIPAQAHWADLAVADIAVGDTETRITLTFPTGLVAFADDNQDGQLSTDEVNAHIVGLQDFLSKQIVLSDGKNAGILHIEPVKIVQLPENLNVSAKTHSTLLLIYFWAEPVQELTMHYDLFLPGVSTASCLANILHKGQVQAFVFTPENREHSLISRSLWQQASSFILLGIDHIFTGYDHILFLISLLMLSGAGISYLLKVVTAFTVAHSITLTLAVLDIVTLSSQVVESAIALTIVYVAAENFWRKDPRGRWVFTFGFGLIHGLGFASALKEVGLPHSNLAVSLASFNIGVEIGQIAIVSMAFVVMSLAFLLMRQLKKFSWEKSLRLSVSACAVVIGLLWFVDRAFRVGFMPF